MPYMMLAETGSTFDVSAVMQTTVDSVSSQLFTILGVVVPAVGLVMGAVIAVKFGYSWLRKLGKA